MPAWKIEMHLDIAQKALYGRIYKVKCRRPKPRRTLRASLRNRNAFGCLRAILCEIYRKNARAQNRDPKFVRACARARAQNRGADFVRACAVEMHLDVSQESAQSKCMWAFHKSHFMQNFTGKMLRTSWSTLIKPPAFTLAVRTPLWRHCLGKTIKTHRLKD